ncbi:hypothetical protein [Arsenicibacter rosenii]|uniref:Phytase-like domain-containing protein n=1 Tax=Arsenicibacter rosenii TaxID=1750698 RepID=A0A1S2VB96_9BACT|nr:hypothetical protein [Arsenicibacter rosenii]OIN55949.1 hypothetical protein BLX24_27300 [Arsenicibacter rosenii]
MKSTFTVLLAGLFLTAMRSEQPAMTFRTPFTTDSLGACQGAAFIDGKAFLYGDREVGMIRLYDLTADGLAYTNREIKLTEKGQDIINHPTGIAWNGKGPTFIGNSIRLNPEGTKWRAVIYSVDWKRLLKTGTLDGNLLNTIDDDACIQGTRPEYVRYRNKWYVATADYGNNGNEVRLMDPEKLHKAKKTSETGVVVKKFTCTPFVQNLHWIPEKGILVLIQNQIEGRRWRFTLVDLAKSIETGKQQVVRVIDTDDADELEGFTLAGNLNRGIAVSSARRNNVRFVDLTW